MNGATRVLADRRHRRAFVAVRFARHGVETRGRGLRELEAA